MIRKLFAISCLALVALTTSAQNTFSVQNYKMSRVLTLIDHLYVDTVDDAKIVEAGIVAMLKELDPHSVYVSPDEVKEMNEPLEGNFEGIGIQFSIINDTLMAVGIIPGGPSERVGLMAGDRILFIDSTNVAGVGITNNDVFKKLRGKKGTKVTVKVLRHGSPELLEFTITRDKIPIYSVDASYVIDKKEKIGYVKVNKFAATTTDEYTKAMEKLRKAGVRNLILDLTDNGGGFLNSGFDLASQFLNDGQMVVYTDGDKQPRQDYRARGKKSLDYDRVVVMVDEGSASASEIVTGALQDWDRAVVVGRRTFGKGLVQNQFPLTDGSMIRLTVARYYTPTGRCIQRPYSAGVDQYEQDFIDRYNHGELNNADSIHLPTSEIYYTLNSHRPVYGGGGIMPDIFVPIDTTYYSDYYAKMIRSGIFNRFVIEYIDTNRDSLERVYKSTKTDADFEKFNAKFEVNDALLQQLIDYAAKNKLEYVDADFARSKEYIRFYLKAAISRDLYDSGEFYQIYNLNNPIFKEAVRVIKDVNLYNSKLAKQKN